MCNGWHVPDFHLDVCEWLDNLKGLNLLMLPRGHSKSTILDVYNAYRLYKDADDIILHQGATDADAYKCSNGTKQVLEKHPLCWNRQKVKRRNTEMVGTRFYRCKAWLTSCKRNLI